MGYKWSIMSMAWLFRIYVYCRCHIFLPITSYITTIFTVLSIKYRWLTSLKTHLCLVSVGWIIVLIIPLPALVTKDIYFRAGFLCWVPRKAMLHISYTIITYYLIPIVFIVVIYVLIYTRVRYAARNAVAVGNRQRQNRDLEVFRNIMTLFGIYILGSVPTTFYMLTGVEVFYSIGIISVSLTVAVEKFVSIIIDREIRNILKKYFCHGTTQVAPMTVNVATVVK